MSYWHMSLPRLGFKGLILVIVGGYSIGGY
jgi:hypothetical protein